MTRDWVRREAEECFLGDEAPEGGAVVSKPGLMVSFVQAFAAVVLGNVVYFAIASSLPPAARHRPFKMDLGMAVDFWCCLVAYGLIRTARRWK